MKRIPTSLIKPFLHQGRLDKPLVALFLAINLLVLINSLLHDPGIGYDGKSHLSYVRVMPYRLPSAEDTPEYFSPPLPYALPSLFDKACLSLSGAGNTNDGDCLRNAGKFAQSINAFLSLGVTFLLVNIAGALRPGNRLFKVSTLALLAPMAVYYKTLAQVRGEPYVVFFTLWAIYEFLKLIHAREQASWWEGVRVGILLGLLALSRQWGFMLYPAAFGMLGLVWLLDRNNRLLIFRIIAISALVAVLVCGWFYLHLYFEYGSFLAFNRPVRAFSFSNQPASFYTGTGIRDLVLFRSPTRGSFDNQFFPILYSDVWGDYWGYFVFIQDRSELSFDRSFLSPDERRGNQEAINPYLGRVNAVSMFPSLLFLVGFFTSAYSLNWTKGSPERWNRSIGHALIIMFVVSAFLLYFYFLITYTLSDQDSANKAAYMLHALVILPLFGAEFLEIVRQRKQAFYYGCMVALGLVLVHNLPAMITRYRMFPLP